MPADSPAMRSHRLFLAGGYCAIALAFLLFGGIPYLRQASAVEQAIRADREEIAARADAEKQLQEIHRKVELINLRVRNYDRLVPPNQDLGPFLTQLSRELDAAGMKEITVRALTPATLGKSQQLTIEVSGSCTYAQFHQFLTRLENLSRMSSVSHLLVEADTPMTGKVTVQLALSIYNTRPS